jgi:hypothetical protein
MSRAVVTVFLVACGESSTSPDTGADAGHPAYECCVDGKSCITSEPVRWCAPSDAGPPGEGCKLSAAVGCYMQTNDAGVVEDAFRTAHLAPEIVWPEGLAQCTSEWRSTCGF